jgi:hypothetical protein
MEEVSLAINSGAQHYSVVCRAAGPISTTSRGSTTNDGAERGQG